MKTMKNTYKKNRKWHMFIHKERGSALGAGLGLEISFIPNN